LDGRIVLARSSKRMKENVYIGTSGWHYAHWKGNFYSKDTTAAEMLRCYTESFSTVEINNSFYRLPTPEAVHSWVRQTPSNFCFALKASRYITHNRKLLDPENSIRKFLEVAKGFGKKLGPILFQLPPGWKVNPPRLAEFLKALPTNRRFAFEFRNPSWHTPEIYKMLRDFNAAVCIFEIGGFQSAIETTADFVYVRLHGPGQAYQGKYSMPVLQKWANRIKDWIGQSCAVYFYFDNDQAGFAAQNALELQSLVQGKRPRYLKDVA
jgi:uncharacterized protein YecE (DUF72 family)